jgi:hypothetical protein
VEDVHQSVITFPAAKRKPEIGTTVAAAPSPKAAPERQAPVVTEEKEKSGSGIGNFFRRLLGN